MKDYLPNIRKIMNWTLMAVMMFCLVGCGKDEISFEVQYVQTNGVAENVNYPLFQSITSEEELQEYYKDNMDNYNFSDSLGTSVSFTTAIDKYDSNYFEDSFLIVVLLEENSSTIFHKVTDITEDGKIVIEKTVPDDGNTDIANWHLLIELDKKYQDTQFQLELKELLLTNEE